MLRLRGGSRAAFLAAILAGLEARGNAARDPYADERRNVAAKTANLLHEARGDELETVGCHEKDGFDLGIDTTVHASHLEFIFEIRDGAQASDNDRGAVVDGEFHQQRVERLHGDALPRLRRKMRNLLRDDGDALLGREQRTLAGVARDADDQAIDQLGRAQDYVGMAVGDRIEGAGINADADRAHLPSPPDATSGPSTEVSLASARCATETTRAPSSSLKTTTPPLPRRRMLMSSTDVRMTVPSLVTSISWSLPRTGKTAMVAPWPLVGFKFSMPCPPRPVMGRRNSSRAAISLNCSSLMVAATTASSVSSSTTSSSSPRRRLFASLM